MSDSMTIVSQAVETLLSRLEGDSLPSGLGEATMPGAASVGEMADAFGIEDHIVVEVLLTAEAHGLVRRVDADGELWEMATVRQEGRGQDPREAA